MKKLLQFVREHSPEFFICILLASVIYCLVTTARLSQRQLDLEIQFYQVQSELGAKLSAIEDTVNFLADWACQSPSVTLGDTYINQSDNSKSLVNSKGKGNNNSK